MNTLIPDALPLATLCLLVGLTLLAATLAGVSGIRRARADIHLGWGDDVPLLAANRAQANLLEVTPFTLLVIGALEWAGGTSALVVALAVGLFVARLAHAAAFLANDGGPGIGRVVGAAGTTLATLVAVAALVWNLV